MNGFSKGRGAGLVSSTKPSNADGVASASPAKQARPARILTSLVPTSKVNRPDALLKDG